MDTSDNPQLDRNAPVQASKITAAQRFADRIMQRLDELDHRLDSLAGHNQPELADASVGGEGLQRIERALEQQTSAISVIAQAVAQLQSVTPSTAVDDHRAIETDEAAAATSSVESQSEEEPKADEPPAVADAWAQIRDALLAEDSSDAAAEDDAGSKADGTTEEEHCHTSEPAPATTEKCDFTDVAEFVVPADQLPQLVDPAGLSVEELHAAVHERDEFITLLMNRLQTRIQKLQPMTTDQLRELAKTLPGELQKRTLDTLTLLDSQVRLGELELSLERAQLARRKSRLESAQERLAASARVLGLTLTDDGVVEGEVSIANKGTRGRQWLGAMGFGN